MKNKLNEKQLDLFIKGALPQVDLNEHKGDVVLIYSVCRPGITRGIFKLIDCYIHMGAKRPHSVSIQVNSVSTIKKVGLSKVSLSADDALILSQTLIHYLSKSKVKNKEDFSSVKCRDNILNELFDSCDVNADVCRFIDIKHLYNVLTKHIVDK